MRSEQFGRQVFDRLWHICEVTALYDDVRKAVGTGLLALDESHHLALCVGVALEATYDADSFNGRFL